MIGISWPVDSPSPGAAIFFMSAVKVVASVGNRSRGNLDLGLAVAAFTFTPGFTGSRGTTGSFVAPPT